jgi:hypothetical protein
MREKIRTRQYVMTLHADEEMDNDNLTIYDMEHGILTGEIIERERDRVTGEWKYRIRGETVDGTGVEEIAKLSPTGKLVIITVYKP